MKKLIITSVFAIFSLIASAQCQIETRLTAAFNSLSGTVTQQKVDAFADSLYQITKEGNDRCFITLGETSDCSDTRDQFIARIKKYVDDLIGKNVTIELNSKRKPWEDVDLYMFSFRISYENTNPNHPVSINFDTVQLNVNEGLVTSATYGRSWIDLDTYGK